jgi:ferredoxin
MRAFDHGADGVLVLGCHIGECHFDSGNHRAAKRIPLLHSMMTFAGLEPERLHLDWVSASEGERFSHLVTDFTNKVSALGPLNWRIRSGEWQIKSPEEIKINEHLDEIKSDWADQERINEIQHQIRLRASELMEGGLVDSIIGYEIGPRGRTRPAFIYKPEDISRLVWNQACTHNLTSYIQGTLESQKTAETTPKIALVAKPCDSKTINVLVAQNQINRDHVHVIGVACDGIHDGAGFGNTNGDYQSRCIRCTDRKPVVYDSLIGDPDVIQVEAPRLDDDLDKLEAMSPVERMNFWLSQFDRCIRCYACRQVCPMCSCPTCLYERAMEIPTNLINRKLINEVEKTFSYRAGMVPGPSPIVTILDVEEG